MGSLPWNVPGRHRGGRYIPPVAILPYETVERLHLRQVLLRPVAPLAVLCTNGAGLIDVAWLPRHDAPLVALGVGADARVGFVAAGAAVVIASAALRVAAKGVLVRRTTLTTAGAYRLVRHPFYLATFVGAVGTFVLAGPLGTVVALVWLALAGPVFAATIAGEERGLRALYPEAWAAYVARVPALLPRPCARPRERPEGAERRAPEARITWANLVSEREPPRLLRFLAGVAAVVGAASAGAAAVAFLASAGLLLVVSYVVPQGRKR